jgi:hypothetical protein
MNKNKLGQITEWSLWKINLKKDYPSTVYLWVDGEGIIRYQREILRAGFMPLGFYNTIGTPKKAWKQFKKVSNHKMTDKELKLGRLLF